MITISTFILFLTITFQTSNKKHHTKCNDFFSSACRTKTQNDWFGEVSVANSEAIGKILSNDIWNKTIRLKTPCKSINNLDHFLVNLQKYLAPENAEVLSVSEYNIPSVPNECNLLITLKGRDISVSMSFFRINWFIDYIINRRKRTNSPGSIKALNKILRYEPKNHKEAGVWVRSFFVMNNVTSTGKLYAHDKARMLYQKCTALKGKEDKGGIKSFRMLLYRKRKKTLEKIIERSGEVQSISPCNENDDLCERFSRYAGKQHSSSDVALFTFRVLDLFKTSIDSIENIGVLIQPHFIGNYDHKLRENNCLLEAKDLELGSEVEFDMNDEKDKKALKRFQELNRLMNKRLKIAALKRLVTFEKSLFKYSLNERHLQLHHSLEKNSTVLDLDELQEKFPHVVRWNTYFKTLFKTVGYSKYGDMKVLVSCESYFHVLNKLMKTTPIETVMDFMEFSSMFSLNLKYPLALSKTSADILGLSKSKTCVELVEYSYPHVIGRQLWDHYNLKPKSRMVNDLIDKIVESFEEMIDENTWMSDENKEKGKKKAKNIKRVIGITPDDLSESHLEDLYKYSHDKYFFMRVFYSVRRNNYQILLRSLFDTQSTGLIVRSLPNEANASYDIRENTLTINPGLLFPPFMKKDMTEMEIYAWFGFVIGHELTHSVGIIGIKFDYEGIYRKDQVYDDSEYEKKVLSLKKKTHQICKKDVSNGLFSKKETISPDFNRIKEEVIADLGGFKLSLLAYEKTVGTKTFESKAPEFIDTMAKMFCGRLNPNQLKELIKKGTHPSDECRLNILSHSKTFKDINQCPNDLTIDVW